MEGVPYTYTNIFACDEYISEKKLLGGLYFGSMHDMFPWEGAGYIIKTGWD